MLRIFLLLLLSAWSIAPVARVSAIPSTKAAIHPGTAPSASLRLMQNSHQAELISTERNEPPSRAHSKAVAVVASVNVLINTLRPDDGVSWQMRLPRIFWEISIMTVAKSASFAISPTLYLLLSIMTGTTALMDIFVWAPLYASFSTFETCTGGWLTGRPHVCMSDYSKGVSRLVASGQSLFGGIFYLMTAIVAWQEYSTIKQEAKLKSQMDALDVLMERHK